MEQSWNCQGLRLMLGLAVPLWLFIPRTIEALAWRINVGHLFFLTMSAHGTQTYWRQQNNEPNCHRNVLYSFVGYCILFCLLLWMSCKQKILLPVSSFHLEHEDLSSQPSSPDVIERRLSHGPSTPLFLASTFCNLSASRKRGKRLRGNLPWDGNSHHQHQSQMTILVPHQIKAIDAVSNIDLQKISRHSPHISKCEILCYWCWTGLSPR